MGTARRQHLDVFKQQALEFLASRGRPLSRIAGELEIPAAGLAQPNWWEPGGIAAAANNLCDQRMGFLINDRLSFMLFPRLSLSDRIPDTGTIWLFRKKLTMDHIPIDRAFRFTGNGARRTLLPIKADCWRGTPSIRAILAAACGQIRHIARKPTRDLWQRMTSSAMSIARSPTGARA